MTERMWTLINAVALLSFGADFITSFVPAWDAAFQRLSPGIEVAWIVWAWSRVRHMQATHDPYPSTPREAFRGR